MSEENPTTLPAVRYKSIKPGYRVGDDGSVWSCVIVGSNEKRLGDTWHRLKLGRDREGYLCVVLGYGDHRYVHHLVLEAFVGPCPEGLEARHFPDRDPTNNRVENLSWATHAVNMADKIIHGTDNRGEKNSNAVLTEADVIAALAMKRDGERTVDIARRFGVKPTAISRILCGQRWQHATGLPLRQRGRKGEAHHSAVMTAASVLEVLAMHADGQRIAAIGRFFGVTGPAIRKILSGRSWCHVTGLHPDRFEPDAGRTG